MRRRRIHVRYVFVEVKVLHLKKKSREIIGLASQLRTCIVLIKRLYTLIPDVIKP